MFIKNTDFYLLTELASVYRVQKSLLLTNLHYQFLSPPPPTPGISLWTSSWKSLPKGKLSTLLPILPLVPCGLYKASPSSKC